MCESSWFSSLRGQRWTILSVNLSPGSCYTYFYLLTLMKKNPLGILTLKYFSCNKLNLLLSSERILVLLWIILKEQAKKKLINNAISLVHYPLVPGSSHVIEYHSIPVGKILLSLFYPYPCVTMETHGS